MGIPIVTLHNPNAGFSDLDEAAQSMCSSIAGPASGWHMEQGGAIFQGPDGSYYTSTTVPGMHDNLSFAANIPKGYKLAALVHSHPTNDESGQYFSPTDMAVAKQLGVPSYVQFDSVNQCRKYTPGKSMEIPVNDLGSGGVTRMAPGEELLLPQQVGAQKMGNSISPQNASVIPASTLHPDVAKALALLNGAANAK